MAEPAFVTCTADAWTKVATDVQTGLIRKVSHAPNFYLQTYRDTGNPVPTGRGEGVVAFESSLTEIISATSGIDVYFWVDDVDGEIRRDTP